MKILLILTIFSLGSESYIDKTIGFSILERCQQRSNDIAKTIKKIKYDKRRRKGYINHWIVDSHIIKVKCIETKDFKKDGSI